MSAFTSDRWTGKLNLLSIKKLAFTLAEVLITLGIIGIVAALTIPTLINNFQERALVAQLKRTYSTLSQAYATAKQNNGEPRNWSVTCSNDVAKIMAQYLQTNKVDAPAGGASCAGAYTTMGYVAPIWDLRKSLNNWNFRPQVQLKSGEMIWFMEPSEAAIASGLTCPQSTAFEHDLCFFMVTDINGQKPPNRFGVDIFGFQANSFAISPFGSANSYGTARICSTTSDSAWGALVNGVGCTAWALQNQNMDYLKYIDGGDSAYNHSYTY